MNGSSNLNQRSDTRAMREGPGLGDDVPCVACGAVALDTGLECTECGHDNYEAVTGKPFAARADTSLTAAPARRDGGAPKAAAYIQQQVATQMQAFYEAFDKSVTAASAWGPMYATRDRVHHVLKAHYGYYYANVRPKLLDDLMHAISEPSADRIESLTAERDQLRAELERTKLVHELNKIQAEINAKLMAELERVGQDARRWQPIETAPKDGTEIVVGWFPLPEPHSNREPMVVRFYMNDYWFNREGGCLAARGEYAPTHWMPLPPPPPARRPNQDQG